MRRAVVALLVLVTAGCGGSGGGARLSREAYVAEADAICRAVSKKRQGLAVPASIEAIPG